MFQKMAKNNPDKYGENCGKLWSKEEENKLLQLIKENKSIDDISNEHKRTVGGIRSRLNHIARQMYDEHKTIPEIQKQLKILNIEQIEYAINKNKLKTNINTKKEKNKINVNKNDNYDELISLVKKLNSTINVLIEFELKRSKIDRNDFDILVNKDIINTNNNDSNDSNEYVKIINSEDYTDDETLSEKDDENGEIINKQKIKTKKISNNFNDVSEDELRSNEVGNNSMRSIRAENPEKKIKKKIKSKA